MENARVSAMRGKLGIWRLNYLLTWRTALQGGGRLHTDTFPYIGGYHWVEGLPTGPLLRRLGWTAGWATQQVTMVKAQRRPEKQER